jgi:hypothetical protein
LTSIEKPGKLDTEEEELSSLYKQDKARQDELGTALWVSAREETPLTKKIVSRFKSKKY